MRREAVDVVNAFRSWVQALSYCAPTSGDDDRITELDQVGLHLRVYVFAVKYEISALAGFAGRKAREGLRALMQRNGGEGEWSVVCERVLQRALEMGGLKRKCGLEALEWLGRPLVWGASGDVWS